MAITQNANRVRLESSAKNGTLGTQGAIDANQIKFDTNISTNNSNLEASPVFKRRHVVLRPGESDQEISTVQSVNGDGVTCTMDEDWETAPASGDAYDVLYRLEDVSTIAGCTYESDSKQWVMTKRLILGTATVDGMLGLSHGQILRCDDRGPTETALRVNAKGLLCIGTLKGDRGERGASILFDNDADDETVMEFVSGAQGCLFEFMLGATNSHTGVKGLVVTVDAGATVHWARAQTHGMNTPFKKRVKRFKDIIGNSILTKLDWTNSAMWNGWCKSEADQIIFDELTSEPTTVRVRVLIEDK